MRGSDYPVLKDLVLIGGGHAHVAVIKRFAMKPLQGLRLTLICPESYTPYSGMLPGLIAGHYTFEETHIDLARLCRFAGAQFIRARVTELDAANRHVVCNGRPPLPYDLLSINSGSTPDPAFVPGASDHVIPVKPVSGFLQQWDEMQKRILRQPGLRIGIVGGGVGGVEMALSVQFALKSLLGAGDAEKAPSIHLVTKAPELLENSNARTRATFTDLFAARGIGVTTDFEVEQVGTAGVEGGGRTVELDEIIWATNARPPTWIRESGLALDQDGFVAVGPDLRSTSHSDVFAAGDIATMVHSPRPKSGVFAVRQARPLADNLRQTALERPSRPFQPQSEFLSLISTGDKYAVAARGFCTVKGAWLWRLKDWIDRRFMAKYNNLPEMKSGTPGWRDLLARKPAVRSDALAALGDLDMRCGGCGAKVGALTLSNALKTLHPRPSDDVILGLEAPDDAAVISVPPGKTIVQSVDSFRAMIEDPYLFGRIAANHSLGDIYAMGGEAQWAMALATLPIGLPEKTGATLTQMMAGAVDVLNDAGCSLVGGHTSEGAELSLGFSVTGYIDDATTMRKAGAVPGHSLVLTKPIGTGTLFAADMRAKAKARWIDAAIDNAGQSNSKAGQILGRSGAAACTDVTGFGVAGHLLEILEASAADAEIDIAAVPVLEGSLETVSMGIVSSLQTENLRRADNVAFSRDLSNDPRFALLFDPQTAGGLLASVPNDKAPECIQALQAAGYGGATTIGRIARPKATPGRIHLC